MRIVSCYTPNLRHLIGPLKESLEKWAPSGHLLIEHEPEQLRTFASWWPRNRFFYCTAQGGEFLDLADFPNPDEVICFIDADSVMQAPYPEELQPELGEFIVCYASYPPRLLNEAVQSLLVTKQEVVSRDSYVEFSAAMLIARVEDWQRLKEIYVPMFRTMRRQMGHHATTQWLINHIVQWRFKLRVGPPWLHNAAWYAGTEARYENITLRVGKRDVVFNHTKFNAP